MATLVDLLAAQLARPEVVARVPEHRQQIWQSFENILLHIGGALLQVAQSPPSPGYEPWFVDRGGGRLGARGLALLLAHAGRRRARDHQWHRKAVDALRDLAKPLRYGSAVRDRVDTLLEAWEASSVIETIFDDAGRDVFEFVRLLKAAQAGNISVFNRLAAIAGALRPVLTVPRGPKPSAASEAHALFLEAARDFGGGRLHVERCRKRLYRCADSSDAPGIQCSQVYSETGLSTPETQIADLRKRHRALLKMI